MLCYFSMWWVLAGACSMSGEATVSQRPSVQRGNFWKLRIRYGMFAFTFLTHEKTQMCVNATHLCFLSNVSHFNVFLDSTHDTDDDLMILEHGTRWYYFIATGESKAIEAPGKSAWSLLASPTNDPSVGSLMSKVKVNIPAHIFMMMFLL